MSLNGADTVESGAWESLTMSLNAPKSLNALAMRAQAALPLTQEEFAERIGST
jgi:hypothetical protein